MPRSVITPVMWVVRICADDILVTRAFCSPMVNASSSTVTGTANGVWRSSVAPTRPNTSSRPASSSSGSAKPLLQLALPGPVDQHRRGGRARR
jgi:hypothetical protein